MVSRVLQVNVRLSEGGAAGVARTLADGLRTLGIASPFAYGYGKHGGISPLEVQYDGVKVTSAAIAALNRYSYGWLGHETRLRSPNGWSAFTRSVEMSDVVHLHAIHSYFTATDNLFKLLANAGRPVVWTFHDQWAMTGRCAQPDACRRWEQGCSHCPSLDAYPPGHRDRAAQHWAPRRLLIRELQEALPTRIVACADWLAEEAVTAGFANVQVIKNSVDPAVWATVNEASVPRRRDSCLFMCRDLRDTKKVNWGLLNRIAKIANRSLTIVGDNPAPIPLGATHRSAVTDRAELAKLLLQHDILVFTSTVDYFPLTIVEALSAGMRVFALDSRAAREFERHPLVRLFSSENSLISGLLEQTPKREIGFETHRAFFDPARMVQEYLTVYEALMAS
jgi:putative colanic acid biosynthesis glycosyltransferase